MCAGRCENTRPFVSVVNVYTAHAAGAAGRSSSAMTVSSTVARHWPHWSPLSLLYIAEQYGLGGASELKRDYGVYLLLTFKLLTNQCEITVSGPWSSQ